jgi:succinate dehydrogenase flavin-adding protein (antitoxin of CptAB toxin-antitoxin module)
MSSTPNTGRIKFLCGRRGMAELDALLEPFFTTHFAELNPCLQSDFAALVEQEEPVLFDWLVAKHPAPTQFKNIVQVIIDSCPYK